MGACWAALAVAPAHAFEPVAEALPPDDGPSPEFVMSNEPRYDLAEGIAAQRQVSASWFPVQGSAVGIVAFLHAPPGGMPGRPGAPSLSLDMGVHWRPAWGTRRGLDVHAWRRLTSEPDAWTLVQSRQPSYGARVEMRLAPARFGGLVADYRFVGLQLQSGARITIRRTNGRPALYYRVQF